MSLVLLCTGLTLTAYDIHCFMQFRDAQARATAGLDSADSIEKAKTVSIDDYMPRHVSLALDVLLTIGAASLSQSTLTNLLAVILGPRFFVVFVICLGFVVSVVLAAIPWAVFYFTRWIEQIEGRA